MSTALLVLAAALWGAAAGALLPRAAYRFSVPEESEEPENSEGAEEPEEPEEGWRERCPGGHPFVGFGGGWIGRARCGQCGTGSPSSSGTPVGLRTRCSPGTLYGPGAPTLATVTALVCAALAAATGTRPELGVWLLLAPVGVLLAVVDLRVRRLPDPLTLPLAAAAPALLGLVALVPEHSGDWSTALWATPALGAFYYLLWLINPRGMGFGDVKLALGAGAVLGWYGWPTVMLGTFAGFLSGALYGWGLVLTGRTGRKSAIPFGPFLLGGTFAGLLIGAYAA
ncbi:prepilin peptidase [Streptomyces sp. NPDC051243]|uniref:prepilin peptidase n=1 Tax=Streptomyces sp. NPDC051243 TaxID=3365646 RepID=UPI0037B29DF8